MHSHFAGVKKNKTKQKSCFIEEIQTDDGNMHVMGFLVCFFFLSGSTLSPSPSPRTGKRGGGIEE